MPQNNDKETNSLQNIFADIKSILDFVEFKDDKTAKEMETPESIRFSEIYMLAKINRDSYITYKEWWTLEMFKSVDDRITESMFDNYYEKPFTVPYRFHEPIYEMSKKYFLDSYQEINEYYRMLNGLPPTETPMDDYVYLSDELRIRYHIDDPWLGVHELPDYVQNLYINTSEYRDMLLRYPDKKYLKYLGKYKIDTYTARKAKDFDIIRYPTDKSDVNPYLLKKFASLYADCREYVMVALYNEAVQDLYVGYRDFMGFLIISYTLLQIGNVALESLNNHNYLDDTMIYYLLSLYRIPDSLILPNEVRRNLAIHITQLTREKGTSEVYYDLIKILGYQDIVINKLVLMKGQRFIGENKQASNEYEPYFVQVDLKDENPYESIISGKSAIFTFDEVVKNDPRWWNTKENRDYILNQNYTSADSKYITIEAMIHQMKYVFESVYFSRMILDNKVITNTFKIDIPDVLGTSQASVYELVLFLICASCMNSRLDGSISYDVDKLLATAGFNFDINVTSLIEAIGEMKYVDKDKINSYLNRLSLTSKDDINILFNDIISPLRDWLENKIVNADNRQEYIEYESIYRSLFTYDINRNKFLDDFRMPLENIMLEYEISEDDMNAFKNFYPHYQDSTHISIEDYNDKNNVTKYKYPFLSLTNEVDWYIHIIIDSHDYQNEDRGYLYFYDILNCEDVKLLTNPDGTRIFMDYEDQDIGWQVNQKAVDKALELIDHLDEEGLKNAYFQIYTEGEDGKVYNANDRLPSVIRSSMYKTILKEKIIRDTADLCNKPTTYFEMLKRENEMLYKILTDGDRFNRNQNAWMNDVINVINGMENELSIHMKYFEQSVIGTSLFFKPLITLINHFKSTLVDIANTGLHYLFDDKIDIGGNSNMLKLFDDMTNTIFNLIIVDNEKDKEFGLYDAQYKLVYNINLNDMTETIYTVIGTGFAAEQKNEYYGSLKLHDDIIFFKNGIPIDNYKSESMTEDDLQLLEVRKISSSPYVHEPDLESWKDYVESYNVEEE